jgi:hypothetical protein
LSRFGQHRRLGRTWTSNAIGGTPSVNNFE